jgi:hypothetical protein
VLEAGENTATAPHNIRLAVGNPDHQLDALHLFGHDQFGAVRPGVRDPDLGARSPEPRVLNNPNIVPGAASWKSGRAPAREVRHGGRLYKSRIRGISPAEAAEALIKLEWVQAAQKRWLDESQRAVLTAGKRGARRRRRQLGGRRRGRDRARQGRLLLRSRGVPLPERERPRIPRAPRDERAGIEPEHVGVDSVGVGVGASTSCGSATSGSAP